MSLNPFWKFLSSNLIDQYTGMIIGLISMKNNTLKWKNNGE